MYNYNLPKPKLLEVDKTVRSFQELHNINGQNYITISAAEGRKLMQRIPDAMPMSIERVFVKVFKLQIIHFSESIYFLI